MVFQLVYFVLRLVLAIIIMVIVALTVVAIYAGFECKAFQMTGLCGYVINVPVNVHMVLFMFYAAVLIIAVQVRIVSVLLLVYACTP